MQRIGIIITGLAGSGSTTLGVNMARALGWPRPYYSGGVVRWLTVEIERRGIGAVCVMSPAEIAVAMESGRIELQPHISKAYKEFPPELDKKIDLVQQELLEKKERGIHEGRVVWFFAKKLKAEGRALDKTFVSFLCVVDAYVGAKRQMMRKENSGKPLQQIMQETHERLGWERERYRGLYGIEHHLDPGNFDIVIDTTALDPERALKNAFHEVGRIYPGLLPHKA